MKKSILSLLSLLCTILLNAAVISVSPGTGTIKNAVNAASAGDILVLADGDYSESSVKPSVALTIRAAEGAQPRLTMSSRFEVKNDFTLEGVTVQSSGEAVRMVTGTALYNVTVKDCSFTGCPSYFIRAYDASGTEPYINQITVDGCLFLMGGTSANTARAVAAPTAAKQIKSLLVRNSTFSGGIHGTGRMIYLHPGSGIEDPVSLQGTVTVDHCTFYNSSDTRGVYLANINGSHVSNCIFMNPEERENAVSFALYGTRSLIEHTLTCNAPIKNSTGAVATACLSRNPYFLDADAGNFMLYSNSPAVNAASDGTTLGDPRWGVSADSYDTSNDPYLPYKMPYSMSPTTTSVKVLWQMSDETAPTEALVCYGTDSLNLSQQITTSDGWNVSEEGYVHVVTLTGLQPGTRYYFTVGADANRRCPKICSTRTAPAAGTACRIFTISDIHGNACRNWANMQDFICNLHCDIALMNGDFVSSKGNDRNWNNYYFTPGAKFLSEVPVMSSAGNHETGDPRGYRWSSFYDYFHQFAHDGAPEDSVTDPRGEAYFHFTYGNADVIMLNLNGDESSPAFLPGSRQYRWADSVFAACTQPWIIVCHHVGVHTTGYHGQWADEPRQMGALFEKHAALGKHIISLSGDDHSFEHLYKDGVHYLRPGCGRDANYAQQKQLNDCRYSMFYRQVSCFSTLDMAADASSIALTAYDSVGNPFYTYTFLLNGEIIRPSVNFTVPATEVSVEDSIRLQWYTFDPVGDATVSFYYSRTAGASNVTGMTPIATNLPASADRYMWHTRNIFPKGRYYIYAVISSGGQTFMGGNTAVINLLDDTTPPPAPTALTGWVDGGHYRLTWSNPTHLVHLDTLITDFSGGTDGVEPSSEDGATMSVSVVDGALRCDYGITAAWATAAAEYVFSQPADLHNTPVLSFRLKGNGTSTSLRIVCKNMSGMHEDWWYTERVTLASADWQTVTLDLATLQSFDWYANSDDRNRAEGVVRLSFGVSTGNPVSGTFLLDDIRLSGDIYPAPDYEHTVIVRRDDAFPVSPVDGSEIYSGAAETCADLTSAAGQIWYYGAFAFDDRGNWSAPSAVAQWKSENVPEWSDLSSLSSSDSAPVKFVHEGQIYIRRSSNLYTPDGRLCSVVR